MTAARRTIDVAGLPDHAFGHRSILWWGTMGLIAIEGTVFVLLIVSSVYLRGRSFEWPPRTIAPPDLLWGTVNTGLLLLSAVPNQLAKMAAERFDLGRTRLWVAACLVVSVAFHWIRVFEFASLNVWWDQTAYGSTVWLLLGLHTFHILTDALDTLVLFILLLVKPVDACRFVDVSENSFYWYFVVVAWLPIYVVLYLLPRLW
jgi:cytochrome c oxidase subunit I+III